MLETAGRVRGVDGHAADRVDLLVLPVLCVVLVAGAAWCGRHWVRRQGPVTATALLLGYAGGFVSSHLLAREIGAWPSVLTVAGAVGAAAWVASDRRG